MQINDIVIKHGLGDSNNPGTRLIDFCGENALIITISGMLLHHSRTWLEELIDHLSGRQDSKSDPLHSCRLHAENFRKYMGSFF